MKKRFEKEKDNLQANIKFVLLTMLFIIIYVLIRINIPSFESTENIGLLIIMVIVTVIAFRKKIS